MAASGHDKYRLTEGSFLGSFRVVRPLGQDAEGETYLATSSKRLSRFLLRVFPAGTVEDPERLQTLQRRCALASAIHHPGVARCSDLACERGLHFVAFELPDGPQGEPLTLSGDLSAKGGSLTSERVENLAIQLSTALGFCHDFRGHGLAHGKIAPECIYLTAQRQPRLADLSLLSEPDPREDIQATGHLLALLLSGTGAATSAAVDNHALPRFWRDIIKRCLAAGTEAGFKDVDELKTALEEGPRRSGKRAVWLAGAALFFVLLAVVAFAWHGIGRPGAGETNHRAATEGGSPPVAVEAASSVETVEGPPDLRAVSAIKARAEEIYAQAASVRGDDGFDRLIAEAKATRKQAAGALAGLQIDEAESAYRRLGSQSSAILQLDQDRKRALQARNSAESASETARGAQAARDAAELWRSAEEARSAARDAWRDRRFDDAHKAYLQAERGFMQAASFAGGARDVSRAKQGYEEEFAAADPHLLQELPNETRVRLEALIDTAGQTEVGGDQTGAARHWQQARTVLAKALDQATAGAAGPFLSPLEQFERPASGNLVLNGGFEAGAGGQPEAWSAVDKLTTFWDTEGENGRCVRFDTAVQQQDKRQAQQHPERPVTKSGGGRYSTVGAHEGVWLFSAPIPVAASDRFFALEVDCMGPAKSTALFYPQVLIRGYRRFDPDQDAGTLSWFQTPHEDGPAFSEQFGSRQRRARAGDYLMVWRHAMPCRNAAPDIWEHYTMGIALPEQARFRPEVILLKLYAMWPLGEYRFDNVTLRSIKEDEYRILKAQGHSIEGFMPTE